MKQEMIIHTALDADKYNNKIRALTYGAGLKAHVVTYGCQMNVSDSERIEKMLIDCGYTITDDKDAASLIMFNTCCVREHAEARVYGNIGALRKLKEAKPALIIGVCGCMMQQSGVAEHIKRRYPFVSFVFGTHALARFPKILYNALTSEGTYIDIDENEAAEYPEIEANRQNKVSAFVTAMRGCNNYCTYCIVPYVRGRENSRSSKEIYNEVFRLAEKGYKEITLLGQNVNSYGLDRKDELSFAQLLFKLSEIEGIERIRFMTSHPKDLSEELIHAIAENKKICSHVHLPVQSGSDRILALMNRKYDSSRYMELVAGLREAVPDIALTTDVIVGFPGETEEDFSDTYNLLEKIKFQSAFLFKYSPRKGTKAALMDCQIDNETIKRRHSELLKLQNEITEKVYNDCIGKEFSVLAETEDTTKKGCYFGKTEGSMLVNFSSENYCVGQIVKVKIHGSSLSVLKGETVGQI